jgi:hypothetical protein
MKQPNFYRVGAASAMVGAVIALVFNLLHPRDTDVFGDYAAEFKLVADSEIWRWDHIMLGLAVAISFIGFIAIGISMFTGPSEAWARAAVIFGTGATAVLLVLLALDGTVMKTMADLVATGDEGVRGAAVLLSEITTALLTASIALFFGLTPLLFGEALLGSPAYSDNLGWAEIVGGAIGLLTALMIAIGGFTALTVYGFLVASLLHTIVVFLAGWTLWKSSTPATAGMTPS